MANARTCLGTRLALFALLLAAACGGEENATPTTTTQGGGGEPTKEGLVAVLREVHAALAAKNYAGAASSLVTFPGMTDEQMQKALAGFIQKREISAAGIDILEAKGRYGPLLEVFPKRGARFAEKAGVDAAACYAMSLKDAEVAAHWDGGAFRLIRLDDVGKLE